jgi:hypothetical protein
MLLSNKGFLFRPNMRLNNFDLTSNIRGCRTFRRHLFLEGGGAFVKLSCNSWHKKVSFANLVDFHVEKIEEKH